MKQFFKTRFSNIWIMYSCGRFGILSDAWHIGSVTVCVQLPSHVQLFATPWTAAHQASLSPHHLQKFGRQCYLCSKFITPRYKLYLLFFFFLLLFICLDWVLVVACGILGYLGSVAVMRPLLLCGM